MSDIDAKQDEVTLHGVRVSMDAPKAWRDRLLLAWAALRGLRFQFNAKTIHVRYGSEGER
jgi:hypothetical protein